jgi:transposase-like protein
MSTMYDVVVEAVKMYEAGQSIKQIAEELDRAPSTIYALLHDAGVALKKDRPGGITSFLDAALVDQVIKDYVSGVPVVRIMKTSGLTQSTIYQILEEREIPRRRSTEMRKTHNRSLEEAVEMYKNGAKLVAIYMKTGVHANQLYQELHILNEPLRRDI